MKVWGLGMILLAAACSAPPPPPVAVRDSNEARELVDRLRDDVAFRHRPLGVDPRSEWFELPPGAYVAQSWPCRAPASPFHFISEMKQRRCFISEMK